MKPRPAFYHSLGLLIILNVIVKPAWIFGIDRQVQNITGAGEYGIYFSLLGFSIAFSFLLDWGITAYVNRHLASSDENIVTTKGSFLLLKLASVLFYMAVVMLAGF